MTGSSPPDWLPHRLMTVPETAELLHLSRRQIWRMIKNGELAVKRFGRTTRVTPEAIAELLEQM